jgi:hypothetical protein
MNLVWYVAYGSNLNLERFTAYLQGGRPFGATRHYPGSRNSQRPERVIPLMIPGGLRFVGVSPVWGGGVAIYDASAGGEVAARAYLIRAEQFADVLAQERGLEPGLHIDLAPVHETGVHSLGTGQYETLAHLGSHDDYSMLTFTSADVEMHPLNAPSARYLRTIAIGLREAHGWTDVAIGRYLAKCPGAAGAWSPESIEGLVA